MINNVSIAHHGKVFTAEYEIAGDILTIRLPGESSKEIQLNGFKPESAAKAELRSFIKNTHDKADQPDLSFVHCIYKK